VGKGQLKRKAEYLNWILSLEGSTMTKFLITLRDATIWPTFGSYDWKGCMISIHSTRRQHRIVSGSLLPHFERNAWRIADMRNALQNQPYTKKYEGLAQVIAPEDLRVN
jgi:hypothetical protein